MVGNSSFFHEKSILKENYPPKPCVGGAFGFDPDSDSRFADSDSDFSTLWGLCVLA